jgi:hypothetical protein
VIPYDTVEMSPRVALRSRLCTRRGENAGTGVVSLAECGLIGHILESYYAILEDRFDTNTALSSNKREITHHEYHINTGDDDSTIFNGV